MFFLRKSSLDTLMQIFIMLQHLGVKKFDDYRVIRTGASDLKLFWGGVFVLCLDSSVWVVSSVVTSLYKKFGSEFNIHVI